MNKPAGQFLVAVVDQVGLHFYWSGDGPHPTPHSGRVEVLFLAAIKVRSCSLRFLWFFFFVYIYVLYIRICVYFTLFILCSFHTGFRAHYFQKGMAYATRPCLFPCVPRMKRWSSILGNEKKETVTIHRARFPLLKKKLYLRWPDGAGNCII